MKNTLIYLTLFALLASTGARAQSTTQAAPPAQQPAKPYSTLDDDPQFKRLSPEQQEIVRKMMESADKAIAAEKKTGAPPQAAPANPVPAPNAQPGCTPLPMKKPKFHIPKSVQDAINKQTKQIGSKTGVDVDPNAPAQTVNAAQGKPCPAPAPKPANQ